MRFPHQIDCRLQRRTAHRRRVDVEPAQLRFDFVLCDLVWIRNPRLGSEEFQAVREERYAAAAVRYDPCYVGEVAEHAGVQHVDDCPRGFERRFDQRRRPAVDRGSPGVRVEEDHRVDCVQLGPEWLQAWVAEVDAVVVGRQGVAVGVVKLPDSVDLGE